MKKLYWIFALIALFFIGDRIGGFILHQLTAKSQFRYSRMYQGQAASDILLIGNSRGLTFYQPYIESITGKKTFNLSYNGMPINLAKVLVQDYLERYKKPELAIIDITMCDRLNKSLIAGFNMYSPYSSALKKMIIDSIPTTGYGGILSHLYRYNSEIFQRSMFYLNKTDEDWLLDRVINEHMIQEVSKQEPKIDVMPFELSELKTTIEHLHAAGVKVQLVISPYYPPYVDRLTNLPVMKSKIEKATGMKVHDYSKEITITKAFGDYQHLNKYGSKMYLDQLKKDGLLY